MRLKPCPFCGGTPAMRENEDGANFIECTKCGNSTNLQYSLKDDGTSWLIERWNNRVAALASQPSPRFDVLKGPEVREAVYVCSGLSPRSITPEMWNRIAERLASHPSGVSGTSVGPQHVGGDRIRKFIEDLEGLKTHAKESSDGVGYQEGRYRAFAAMQTALKHELAVATESPTPKPGEHEGERERLVRVDEHLRTCTRCKANIHSHCDRWNQLMACATQPPASSRPARGTEVLGDRVKKLVERAAAWTESDLRKHPTTTLELIDALSDTLAELALPSPTHQR